MQRSLAKFYLKYPEVKYMPIMGPIHVEKNNHMTFTHPASVFIRKQKAFMKKGYSEHKAF